MIKQLKKNFSVSFDSHKRVKTGKIETATGNENNPKRLRM
jgi:hypothetical protein